MSSSTAVARGRIPMNSIRSSEPEWQSRELQLRTSSLVSFFWTFWPWLLGIGSGAAAWGMYRKFTHLKRLAFRVDQIQKLLCDKQQEYVKAKETITALQPRDRQMAEAQMANIGESGEPLCCELQRIGLDVAAIKENIMQKLGKVPAEELSKKLEPLSRLESIIEQIQAEFRSVVSNASER